jgi:hypothetical protein
MSAIREEIMKKLPLYRHTLFFESDMAAETAELIVPSHVEGFVNGVVNEYSVFNAHAYTFLTHGELPEIACKDIIKLSRAQQGSMNTRH